MAEKDEQGDIEKAIKSIGGRSPRTEEEAKRQIEHLDLLLEKEAELNIAEKIRVSQIVKRLDLMADEDRLNAVVANKKKQIASLETEATAASRKKAKDLGKQIEDLKNMRKEASKWHNMISTSDKTHIRALKEELKLGSKQITQLKAIEAISQRAAVKKGAGAAGDKTSGPGRRGVMDLYKDAADTFAKVDLKGVLSDMSVENAVLESITGVRGTLFGDYYTAMDSFTNSIDTGFRGMIRSGIQFTGDLKEVFERSIDPIQGLAQGPGAAAMIKASENMGGMFTSIGSDGTTANKAITALKNNTSFLRDEFIKAGPENEAIAAHFANLTQGLAKLGIAEQDVAVNLDFFIKGLKQTPKQASESVRALENVAHSLDVNVGQAFKDFTALQGELAQYGDDTIRVFGNLQAQAVSTGVAVGDLNSVADRLDTFKGAAQAAQGFNAVLGKTVLSVTDLVHAEPAEKIQLLKDALDKSGISFDTANRRIKKMIAGFMGVDVAKASKIFGSDDDYFTLKENLDGSASSMEDLDKRVRSSMTNAEKMTSTLSSIGIASAEAIDRARENADNSSQTLVGIIAQMGDAAKTPLDVLTALRKSMEVAVRGEGGVSTAAGGATNITAYLAAAKAVLRGISPEGYEDAVKSINNIRKGFKLKGGVKTDNDGKPILESKYSGGWLKEGEAAVVGESRPGGLGELFVPDSPGRVIPNKDINNPGNISIQINSPVVLKGENGQLVTVGHFDHLFERKFDQGITGAPNPVVL